MSVFLILALFVGLCRILISSGYFDIRPNPSKKVIVVFRNDDIQEFSGSKPEIELFNLFEENRIPQTYGLVPFKGDVAKNQPLMTLLRKHLDLRLAEIALHGYTHENLGSKRLRTEFLGRPLVEQSGKISKGKTYLETLFDTKVTTFIPPNNSYDVNTVNACKENGIRVLSASAFFYGRARDVIIVNPNLLLTGRPVEEIDFASRNGAELSICILYYHSYMADVYAKDDYYGTLKDLISYVKSRGNIEVMTLGEAAIRHSDYFEQRCRTDLWGARIAALLDFLKQDSIHGKLKALSLCEQGRKLSLFILVSMCYIYGFLFLTGFLTGLLLVWMRPANWGGIYFVSAMSLLMWLIAVSVAGADARIGAVDMGMLILVLGFIGNNLLTFATEFICNRFRTTRLTVAAETNLR